MDWFGNLLSYYFDVLKEQKNDICSTLLLDHVTACMMDIRGVETLPILQKIYRTYHIKPYGIPSINELKKKNALCGNAWVGNGTGRGLFS